MKKEEKYPFKLPDLPYAKNALEPIISTNTLSFHYDKHHQTYVTNLNNLIKDRHFSSLSLEDIIKETANEIAEIAIFNNAAQVWNHTFYWHCMRQNGGGAPTDNLLKQIERDFDNYNNFRAEFSRTASSQFGSGWAWLIWDKGQKRLLVTKTENADLPMVHEQVALFTIDVWEHAYYLDYQNRRVDYIAAFLDHLVNWQFAEEIFARC
ncbi:MAG: superoxide dismutase [Candidatus Midichloria sp.]|nr:MAG: superoxide dismutase [Candidatus Midichloria sp.]